MLTCPACDGKLVWRLKVQTCLGCKRRYTLDGSEITYPACTQCGNRTIPWAHTKTGVQRYKCLTCHYQSAMDDTSRAAIEQNRVRCGICGGTLKKHGFSRHDGRQLWFCRTCHMQSADMPTKKPSMKADSPSGHSFFDGYTVIGYEPPAYCNKKTPCSACKYLLRCQSELFGDNEQMACEGMYLVQTGGETMRL